MAPVLDPNYFYHYTNKPGLEEIKKSRTIKNSTRQGDIILGRGVYLTDLSPANPKMDILLNNYGSCDHFQDHTDYYIKIPKQKVHTSRSNDLRHVFLCSGDLDLNPVWDQIQFCKHPQAGSDEGITWTTAVMMAVLALFMALLLGLRTH